MEPFFSSRVIIIFSFPTLVLENKASLTKNTLVNFLSMEFYFCCCSMHSLNIMPWRGHKTFVFFHVHPRASRPLDVDRTRLLFNSAKIPLDISMNYTSKGTFHKSAADIEAFLNIEIAAKQSVLALPCANMRAS